MKGEWFGQWTGRTIVCIASGPSLTEEDALKVRESGLLTIVTNTTFRMCLWADILLAHDAKWCLLYKQEIKETFKGRFVTCSPSQIGVHSLRTEVRFRSFANSGCAAISLAVLGKADKVVLLGFDCKPADDGRRHWHADHPEPLRNALTIDRWHAKFAQVASYAKQNKVRVINASRDTALQCFERMTLDAALLLP